MTKGTAERQATSGRPSNAGTLPEQAGQGVVGWWAAMGQERLT
ncbi:MAG: hypothetical protein ACR2M5_09485 [Nakamurella sp.]